MKNNSKKVNITGIKYLNEKTGKFVGVNYAQQLGLV